jgi:integration host factor beta subunit
MTKSLLIDKITEKLGDLTGTQTEIIVDIIFEAMKNALIKGDKVEIRGFANFRLKNRKPRQARNPKTGVKVEVPGKKVISFKMGKDLKELLNSETQK